MNPNLLSMRSHLIELYGEPPGLETFRRLSILLDGYRDRILSPPQASSLSERDSILITYGDQVQAQNEKPLKTLNVFCKLHLTDIVSGIHILPFFPSTSDDGFSVLDYRKVDPALGDWDDITSLRGHFRLMYDAVVNHISSRSEWFQGFLRGDPRYRDYFIAVDGLPDLSQVVRPRTLPLLTNFKTSSGEKRVWTTFSEDQVDLNYKNSEVLLEILDVLLMYAERGADFIRLDAIAYLWKEIGTTCIHLPQAHRIIQFLRAAFDEVAPHVHLITETNVPHTDNVSYFGDGTNEAQLVYNFALPPLTLHTFHTGDARLLSDWARTFALPSDKTTFFNFLASHDGIGLNPVRGILSDADIASLVDKTLAHGGLISYKQEADGTQSPYEMNINYFDALSDPNGKEPLDLQVERFLAAQAIMLSLVGVPGIYFHSLFGSRGWLEGVRQTGHNRTINREKLQFDKLQEGLAAQGSLRSKVFRQYRRLLLARGGSLAFHPHGKQCILDLDSALFALVRQSPSDGQRVLCLQNISGGFKAVKVDFEAILSLKPHGGWLYDLVSGKRFNVRRKTPLRLYPYQTLWLALKKPSS